jgi:hypothetical protein
MQKQLPCVDHLSGPRRYRPARDLDAPKSAVAKKAILHGQLVLIRSRSAVTGMQTPGVPRSFDQSGKSTRRKATGRQPHVAGGQGRVASRANSTSRGRVWPVRWWPRRPGPASGRSGTSRSGPWGRPLAPRRHRRTHGRSGPGRRPRSRSDPVTPGRTGRRPEPCSGTRP